MRVSADAAPRVALAWAIAYAVVVWPLYVWDVRASGLILWLFAMFVLPIAMAVQLERAITRLCPELWYMSYVWVAIQLTLLLMTYDYLMFDQPPWQRPQFVPWDGPGRDIVRKIGFLSSLLGPPIGLLWIRSALKRSG